MSVGERGVFESAGDRALEEIESGKGKRYDTQVVDASARLFRDKGYKLPE